MRRLVSAFLVVSACAGRAAETDPDSALDSDADGSDPADEDGDGWARPTDCDDDQPGINPGALERCRNAVDDDCDGMVDEVCYDIDADADFYTGSEQCCGQMTFLPDLDADGGAEIVLGAGKGAAPGGAAFIITGADIIDATGEDLLAHASVTILASGPDVAVGGHGSEGAKRVLGTGDVDGDGLSDLLIASQPACYWLGGDDATCYTPNLVYVFSAAGLMSGPRERFTSDADATITGGAVTIGEHVVGMGDIGDDGMSEIGVLYDSGNLIFSGSDLVPGALLSEADAAVTIYGEARVDASSDIDGDGRPDVALVSGGNADVPGHIWLASPDDLAGSITLDDIASTMSVDVVDSASFGYAARIADLDGDGKDDVLVTAPYDLEDRGRIFVLASDTVTGPADPKAIAMVRLEGAHELDRAGQAIAISPSGSLLVVRAGATVEGEAGHGRACEVASADVVAGGVLLLAPPLLCYQDAAPTGDWRFAHELGLAPVTPTTPDLFLLSYRRDSDAIPWGPDRLLMYLDP